MNILLGRVDKIVNWVEKEKHLPLEDSKHEKLVLGEKKRRIKKEVKWVKWLGLIPDENLTN